MVSARLAALLVVGALGVAGCTTAEDPPLPAACREGEGAVKRALRSAPDEVRLRDGTPLSACVRHARDDAELQEIGLLLTSVAEDFEDRAPRDRRAALQLGYLIGAARRGATEESVQAELVYRLERSAALPGAPPAVHRAVREGMRAGEATG